MLKNVGSVDRVIRIVVAVVVAVLLITGVLKGAGGVVLGILGAVFLVTGIVGTCPLYMLFRLSTKPRA